MKDDKKPKTYKPSFDIFSMLDQMMKLNPHNESQAMRNDEPDMTGINYKNDLVE